jgi:hypothetical protein
MRLPEKLRKVVERRLIEQEFRNYEGVAQWIRRQGHEISVNSLQRYGMSLARDLEATRSLEQPARAEALPGCSSVTTEGLMQLAQAKLCSALAEIDQLKQGDMSRLAHAVAHLTQAAISLQRWTGELSQRTEERERADPEAKSKLRGGLSPATSQALRNALLGIAPFNPEQIGSQKAAAGESEASPPATTPIADESKKDEETSRTGSVASLKKMGRL